MRKNIGNTWKVAKLSLVVLLILLGMFYGYRYFEKKLYDLSDEVVWLEGQVDTLKSISESLIHERGKIETIESAEKASLYGGYRKNEIDHNDINSTDCFWISGLALNFTETGELLSIGDKPCGVK